MDQAVKTSPGAGHGRPATYLTGFGLSVLLTGGAFTLVWLRPFAAGGIFAAIMALAVAQMAVHLTLFLHLNRSSAQRWNVVVLAFAALILVILISGSVWIMSSATTSMMPPNASTPD